MPDELSNRDERRPRISTKAAPQVRPKRTWASAAHSQPPKRGPSRRADLLFGVLLRCARWPAKAPAAQHEDQRWAQGRAPAQRARVYQGMLKSDIPRGRAAHRLERPTADQQAPGSHPGVPFAIFAANALIYTSHFLLLPVFVSLLLLVSLLLSLPPSPFLVLCLSPRCVTSRIVAMHFVCSPRSYRIQRKGQQTDRWRLYLCPSPLGDADDLGVFDSQPVAKCENNPSAMQQVRFGRAPVIVTTRLSTRSRSELQQSPAPGGCSGFRILSQRPGMLPCRVRI